MVIEELIHPDDRPAIMRALLLRHRHVNDHSHGSFHFGARGRKYSSYSSLQVSFSNFFIFNLKKTSSQQTLTTNIQFQSNYKAKFDRSDIKEDVVDWGTTLFYWYWVSKAFLLRYFQIILVSMIHQSLLIVWWLTKLSHSFGISSTYLPNPYH